MTDHTPLSFAALIREINNVLIQRGYPVNMVQRDIQGIRWAAKQTDDHIKSAVKALAWVYRGDDPEGIPRRLING